MIRALVYVAYESAEKGWNKWRLSVQVLGELYFFLFNRKHTSFAVISLLLLGACGAEKVKKDDFPSEAASTVGIMELYMDKGADWYPHSLKADSLQELAMHAESLPWRQKALESGKNENSEVQNYLRVKRNHSLAMTYNYAAEGIPLLADAFQLMDSTKLNTDEKISLLNAYYHFLGYNGKWSEALPVATKIHTTLSTTTDPDPESLSSVLFDIAYIHNKIGNYPEAVEFYEQALEIQIGFLGESHQEVGLTYNNLAFNYGLLGLADKEYQTYQKASKTWEEADGTDQSYLMTVYGNLINWNLRYGDLNEAEGLLAKIRLLMGNQDESFGKRNRLIAQKKDDPNTKLVLNYWNKHIHVLSRQGKLDEATKYRDSVAALVSTIDHSKVSEYLIYLVSSEEELAELHFLNGNLDAAISHYLQALNLKGAYEFNPSLLSDTYAKIALIHLDKNNLTDAKSYIDSAIAAPKHSQVLKDYYFAAAKISLASLNLEEANAQSTKALAILTGSDSLAALPQRIQLADFSGQVHSNYISGLTVAGQTYLSIFDSSKVTQDLETARHLFQLALEMLNSYYLGGAYTDALASMQSKIQLGLLECQLRSDNPQNSDSLGSLIEKLENNRSSQDWKKFIKNARHADILIPDSIQRMEDEHRKLIAHYKDQWHSLQNDSAAQNQKDFLKSKLHHHERELQKLEAHLDKVTPQYLSLSQSHVNLAQIQAKLDKQTTLLRYLVTDSTAYLFEISKSKILLHRLGSTDQLREMVNRTMDQLRSRDKAFYTSSSQLFTFLSPPPVEKELLQNLLIIPDDIINYVPFEALTPAGKSEGFLINRHEISYSSSLPLWLLQSGKKNPTPPTFAAFAPDYSSPQQIGFLRDSTATSLPGAASEAMRISELLGGMIHQGTNLDKAFFLQKAPEYSILHLAMHAEINDQEGERSNFVFADDSRLHAYELYNMRLDADLATLSACNTGYGPIKKGEGVKSLATAFSYAGVPSLIMGLWQLPDKSSETLMVSFYQSLLDGQPKNIALAHAKREYLKANPDEELSHPFYWAGLVVSGNIDPIQQSPILIWPFALASILIIGGIGWKIRTKG
ncbi:CHAT domain-containing protein [Algoriphagus sp. 4150]|uniref:CHAT domain-containing protein n=1 Tax=Algoriphagus sp. 4150 TaxID=2817756 RepID=UPI0028601DC8|nr:CHAT domain-containing protein [Algoriphagus sp. 4150]MDR7128984.1 CHAT domain-containing protein [Algoriphagus sp. 4150]